MRPCKRLLLRAFFVGEIGAFAYFYIFSAQGMVSILQLREENKICQESIVRARSELVALEHVMETWGNDDFYKERIAREQLQMARQGEEIYYLT